MPLLPITHNADSNPDPKFAKKLDNLNLLLKELDQRELPGAVEVHINSLIIDFNKKDVTDPKLHKKVCVLKNNILRHLEKKLKVVTKGYYQQQWLAIGMGSFGMLFGIVFANMLDNMAFLGIGLPIGMCIGMAIGAQMDQKAAKENRQLKFKPGITW